MADEITDAVVTDVATAIHNLSCPTFAEASAECSGPDAEEREQAKAAITACLSHQAAKQDAEIAPLRAELADYSEQYGEQREALNRERARMTAVADALTFGAADLVGAVTGEEVKDRAGEIVRGLAVQSTLLRKQIADVVAAIGEYDLAGRFTAEDIPYRAGDIVRAIAADAANLREYAKTTKHHQDQHAEAHRALVKEREENDRLRARDAAWKVHTDALTDQLSDIWVLVERPARKLNDLQHDDVCTVEGLTSPPEKPAVLADPAPSTPEEQQP